MGNSDSCDHGGNSEARYDHVKGDSLATTHYKNEANAALNRAESFSPSGPDQLSSGVQSFVDAHTLKNAERNIAPGCGKCHGGDRDKKEKKSKKDKHRGREQDRDDHNDSSGERRNYSPDRYDSVQLPTHNLP